MLKCSILLFICTNLMGQDSTRLIGIPKWQVERLITDAILYRSCDTLQAYQFEVIKKAVWTIQTMDSLLTLRADEIGNLMQQKKFLEALDANSQATLKNEKKKLRKWKLGAGFVSALLILSLL